MSTMLIGIEIFLMAHDNVFEFNKNAVTGIFILAYFFYLILESIIKIFVNTKWDTVVATLPGIILFIRLWLDEGLSYIGGAVLIAAVLRILFCYMSRWDRVQLFLCFILDAIVIYLWWFYDAFNENTFIEKILIICLVLLTLSSIQQLIYKKSRGVFPFHYFLLLGMVLVFMPVKDEPIDWTPVTNVCIRISDKAKNAYYYLEDIFAADTYTTGYSSLAVTGGSLEKSGKPQLILKTSDKPYFVYTDYEAHMRRKVRKYIYLEGGRGIDKSQLVSFLAFLYNNNLDAESATVFSKIATLQIEYSFLNTPDEIAPASSIMLLNEGEPVTSGKNTATHEKGYKLDSKYIDIDYGSPYLMELLANAKDLDSKNYPDYQAMTDYVDSLYNIDFTEIVSRQQYQDIVSASDDKASFLAVGNASERMVKLSDEITQDTKSDYEKAKNIEAYLRQYTYNTDSKGGYNQDSTMATAEGMADIADRFLFDTREGYCVHFTSSMVMLLRLSGIPARAAIGYRYVFPFEEEDNYVVTGECAHVWPEAYIKNVGWVPFEPTSSYATASAYTWHKTLPQAEQQKSENKYVNTNLPGVTPTDDSTTSAEKESVDGLQIIKLVALVIATILALIVLLILGNLLFKKLRYKYATPNQRLSLDMDDIKSILIKNYDADITDRGLLTDYLKCAPNEMESEVRHSIDLYYKMKYSQESQIISEDEISYVRDTKDKLKKLSKSR